MTHAADPIAVPDPPAGPAVDWRRNLLALWLAQFASVLGVTAMIPFIALFLVTDLRVRDPAQLALWTGACAAASGLGLALSSPIWGIVGDRVGRKPMLLRATLAGGVVLVLTGLVHTPLELFLLRLLYGLVGQPRPIAQALVASETPRENAAGAMGTLASAISLGAALGPGLGGLAAAAVGIRVVFVMAGGLLIVSAISVVLMVAETARSRPPRRPGSPRGLRLIPAGSRPLLAVLLGAQALQFTIATAVIPLMAIRLLGLTPGRTALVTGLAFAGSGAAGAVAGLAFGRVVGRIGYRAAAAGAELIVVLALVAIVVAGQLPVILVAYAAYGFASAFVLPVTTTLIGLETPVAIHSTVFGITTTAQAVGIMAGPLLGGTLAAYAGAPAGFLVVAVLAAGLGGLMATGLREPGTSGQSVS